VSQPKKPIRFIPVTVLIPVGVVRSAIEKFQRATGENVAVKAEIPVEAPVQAAPIQPAEKPLSARAARVLRIIENLCQYRGRHGATRAEIRSKMKMTEGQWTQVVVELKARNLIRAVVPTNPKCYRDYTWQPMNKQPAGKPMKAPKSKGKTKNKAPNLKVLAPVGADNGQMPLPFQEPTN